MLELYVDNRGEIALENLEELLAKFPEHAERAAASALRSEGWRLQHILKNAIRQNGPENAPWPELNPHTAVLNRGKKRWLKNWKSVWRTDRKTGKKHRGREYWEYKTATRQRGGGRSSEKSGMETDIAQRRNPMSKFAGAIRYEYDDSSGLLSVGFVRASFQFREMLQRQMAGYATPVTDRTRRRSFALGFPLKKSTSQLVTPPRPLIGPVFAAEQTTIRNNLERQVFERLHHYIGGGKS